MRERKHIPGVCGGFRSCCGAALLFLAFIPAAIGQTKSYSKPAGFVRISIPSGSGSKKAVSIPFVPFDSSIDALFDGQLTGKDNDDSADKIYFWDAVNQIELSAFKADDTGDENKNGKWFNDDSDWIASPFTFSSGEGFSIENNQSSSQTVFLSGKLVLDSVKNITLQKDLNLFSYPFSTKINLNSTDLFNDGANGATTQAGAPDLISTTDSIDYWLYIEAGETNSGKWFDTGSILADLNLIPGRAFWYNNKGTVPFQWSEERLYGAKWDNLDEDSPEIIAMTLNEYLDEMTLSISCTGTSGETLEIFFKDFSDTGTFDIDSTWNLAATGISTNSQTSIDWTDDGESSPTAPVIARDDITSPYTRIYMVSRQDLDSDGDDLSDGREIFFYQTDPNDSDTDNDGLTDGAEINHATDATDPNDADSDNDGYSDGVELSQQYPTDPNDDTSFPNDTQVPTAPADLEVSALGKTVVALTWTASTDDVQVAGYKIYRNSREVGRTTSTGFVDFNLTQDVACSYYVKAYDLGSNVSTASSPISAIPNQSTATKFYVDAVDGNDGNNGSTTALAKRSIHGAVDAASSGDLIIVAEGTYNGDINISGKDLVIIAEDGPEKTIIDCTSIPGERGIYITGGSAYETIIEGFTIKSGTPSNADGGGILIDGASPIIAECVIKNNSAENGGGIAVTGSTAKPEIIECEITENSASGDGGGIFFTSSAKPKIRNCVVKDNTATGKGAGIYGE